MTVETTSGGEPVTKSGPYNGNGVTAAFDYDFQIQDETELLVTRQNADLTEDVLTLTTHYTVAGVGSDTGGTITLVDPATDLTTGEKLVIQYDGEYNQSVDYSNQGSIQLSLLEDGLDQIVMHLRSLKELVDRAVKVDAFNTVDLDTLTTNITALAAIASDISTVAADIADVSTLAALDTEITALGAIAADIASVAAVDTDVTAVAAIDTAVSAVAAVAAAVSTVAGIAANVTTVAGIAANVTTVAGIAASVAAVALIAADVAAVAAVDTEVAALSAITADISEVASISADITTLAGGAGGTITGDFVASGVWDFTSTEALRLPVGTTAQRPSVPVAGDTRRNSTTNQVETYDGTTWGPLGGAGLFKGENGERGDTVSGAGDIFRVHEKTLNTDVTIDADENAVAVGPLTIASGVTLTVTSGGNLRIV